MTGKKRAPRRGAPKRKPARDAAPVPAGGRSESLPETKIVCSVVGIGASAGGLAAFTELLRALPADSGMAYVLVQHLDPSHESALAEILARVSRMPVLPAADGLKIESNHVYVIPPDTRIALTDGHLSVTPREQSRGLHTPIDHFFQSLASTYKGDTVGIVLSGTGADGTVGIQAIRAAGGITMAQDGSAQHASMPQNAMGAGAVDLVLSPGEMAAELARIGHHVATRPKMTAQDSAGGDDFAAILVLPRQRTDVDFRQYKPSGVQRRVLRRMLFTQHETFAAYLAELRANPAEIETLYHSLLIGVSSFFRDPEVFEALASAGLPEMFKHRPRGGPVRVWVPECVGGEEAYSIAMCLLEYLDDSAADSPIQIFGTDLSDPAVAKARAGLYPKTIAADVSPQRLRRFFARERCGYRIGKAVRDLCVFARQDLARDPPFSQMDIVSCRNVLIYLEPELQKRLFLGFHFAMRPAGLLLLGTAESVSSDSELFTALDKRHSIYRKLTVHGQRTPIDLFTSGMAVEPRQSHRAGMPAAAAGDDPMQREADRLLLSAYMPSSVVVDERLRIVQFHGRTGGYLEHTPGTATLDLLRLARPELAAPLRAAIRQADKTRQTVRTEGIELRENDAERRVDIEVIPFHPGQSGNSAFIVLFAEGAQRAAPVARQGTTPARRRGKSRDDAARLETLGKELSAARSHIREITEEHEAATEELRAANEEIQSSNEELQSTNEELETAKEELQASNEELTTVNDELRWRNVELNEMNADLANVLGSSQIPLIIVGSDLRIRRFTPAASEVMEIVATDAGRPVSDIKLEVSGVDLDQIALHAMESLSTTERKVQDAKGRWWMLNCTRQHAPVRDGAACTR